MQAADTPRVEQAIQRALANESSTTVLFISTPNSPPPPLTVNDARRIIACLENLRFDTLEIRCYSLHDADVLNVLRDGLPLCTLVTTVILDRVNLTNEDLDHLRLAFYNTSVTKLQLRNNDIQGQRGGEVLRDLLVGNDTLRELNLIFNFRLAPEVAIGFGQGLISDNHCRRLQILTVVYCHIGNEFLANLLPRMIINNSLLHLDLSNNDIQGEDGGRQLTLLLQHFPTLKVLKLNHNNLGPLGACALAPGLATAIQLQELSLRYCYLGNDGVANLVPDGQVNRSLTKLDLSYNNIQGNTVRGGEKNIVALASRSTNLDIINVHGNSLSLDQQHHLDLVLDRKRLCTEASAVGGSPFSVLFHFVEKGNRHELGLSAIVVILQK